ncbi:MAG: phosphatase PAP2 family protein [Candidatus Omnitrophica bacterium]|nr:phosphatase PAP2 family protein [Candidatus Omnitrophota bacterium]
MNKHLLAFYALVAVSIIGLTFVVQRYPISGFDFYMTREIQGLQRGNFTPLMEFISFFGNSVGMPISVVFASLIFYLTYHRREAGFTFAVVLPDLFNLLLKILVHRPRPTLENAKILLKFNQSSFPSGHVVHYVVFFGFLLAVMIVNKKIPSFWRILIGTLSAFLILTVSISRIYLGAHWATDVIGGYLFGFVYLGIILKFYLSR